jgi:hypothetical protein
LQKEGNSRSLGCARDDKGRAGAFMGNWLVAERIADRSAAPLMTKRRAECCGIPLKPHGTPGQAKQGLTPISCHAVLERSACAPFIKERRMECINATSLHRKSGPWGTQPSLPMEGNCRSLPFGRDDKGWSGASMGNWLVAERIANRRSVFLLFCDAVSFSNGA